jgi:hypothetical protein
MESSSSFSSEVEPERNKRIKLDPTVSPAVEAATLSVSAKQLILQKRKHANQLKKKSRTDLEENELTTLQTEITALENKERAVEALKEKLALKLKAIKELAKANEDKEKTHTETASDTPLKTAEMLESEMEALKAEFKVSQHERNERQR